MQRYSPLQSGDTIGIAAPASPFDKELFQKGREVLERLGFKVFFFDHIFSEERYFAGDDERRAQELSDLFRDPQIKAIMFARGGYGSQRIIPLLDRAFIQKHPKPVVGFSDMTSLLTWLHQLCRIPIFYGPVLTQLGRSADPFTIEHLQRALMSKDPLGKMPLEDTKTLKPGKASGKFVGGCLSLLSTSMGTAHEIDLKNTILFFEDIDEKVIALDRMIIQLKQSGKLSNVQGIVIGTLKPREGEKHDVKQMLKEIFSDFKGPIVVDVPAGHDDHFVTLPLGIEATLAASATEVSLTMTQGSFG